MRSIRTKGGQVHNAEAEPVAVAAEPPAVEPVAAPQAEDIAEALKDLEAGLINLREQQRQHEQAGKSLQERIWQQEGAIKFARLLQQK